MKSLKERKMSCKCSKCIVACWQNPGWFGSIKEVEGAAELLNLSIEQFAEKYLIQEWWISKNKDILIPASRRDFSRMDDIQKKVFKEFPTLDETWKRERTINGKGFIVASWGHNLMSGYACIFLTKDNNCLIHESKPMECRELLACKKIRLDRKNLLPYWRRHQNWFDEISNKINNCK
ncbi:hypothetical protein LCGC14_1357350 [marine sediment metagenome]|uniref:YkgJ family cysteine cluster protein n=1 Tax=marine sediment metagenome TaxID=412755 RepID=A0A0F9KV70_9ZZZZ